MSGWYGGLYFDEGQILSLEESDAQLRAVTPQAVQKLAKYYFASERHNAALVGKVGEVEADAVDRILKTIWS